ncbi:MAG: helix-turn-helix domain-containing protein [Monoglobales bacterium]
MKEVLDTQLIKEIGNKVKTYRTEKGYSQKKLAEMAMVSSSCITRLESGNTMVSICTLKNIAVALNVPITLLVSDNSEMDSKELKLLQEKLTCCPLETRHELIRTFERIVDVFLWNK